jgi:hypothetical protein
MRRIARIETDISEIVGEFSVDFDASRVSFLMIKTSGKGITLPEPYFHSDLYSSPSIIRIIKSRRIEWAGHVARMGRRGTRIG